MIRSLLPTWLKLCIRHCINLVKDVRNGYLFSYAKKGTERPNFKEYIPLNQSLRPNDAKLHNLRIAIAAIEEVIIQPREIFSFWKVVGKPSKRNGFLESRSILGNQIRPTVGGGLCQLSGLLYYVSLVSSLEILERHNHSQDIYNEKTRFSPLGSDATVAYGYKDLKIRNNSTQPIGFTFQLTADTLSIFLNHQGNLKSQKVDFVPRLIHSKTIEVDTIVKEKIVVTSSYQNFLTEPITLLLISLFQNPIACEFKHLIRLVHLFHLYCHKFIINELKLYNNKPPFLCLLL